MDSYKGLEVFGRQYLADVYQGSTIPCAFFASTMKTTRLDSHHDFELFMSHGSDPSLEASNSNQYIYELTLLSPAEKLSDEQSASGTARASLALPWLFLPFAIA